MLIGLLISLLGICQACSQEFGGSRGCAMSMYARTYKHASMQD